INYQVSPWFGLLAGMVVAVAVAAMIGVPSFQLSGHYFALATLALLQITNILFTYFKDFTGGSTGLYIPILGNKPGMFQFESAIWYYYVGIAFLIMTLIVSRQVLHSKFGYRLLSLKQNPN